MSLASAADNAVINETELLQQLRWRYATKIFDPNKKIDSKIWSALEDVLVLSPSSFGLQPWKFRVIENPAIRAQLKAASWGQTQVVDASHLVVFTSRSSMTPQDVQKLIDRTAEVRNLPVETLTAYKNVMLNFVASRSPEQVVAWSQKQAYIAMGMLLSSAAMLGIDTCPLEGLDPTKYDEILGLTGGEYRTSFAVVLGYRAANDKYASLAKVRYEKSDVIEHIK